MALTVAQLVSDLPGVTVTGEAEYSISSVTADSRRAGPDDLFIAVRGTAGDGHDYLEAALRGGCRAIAVMADVEVPPQVLRPDGTGPVVVVTVPDTRSLPAVLARRLNGFPDRSLLTAAVTGTNGKTTVAFLLRALLGELHGPCGLLGTICYDDGRHTEPAPLTTPGGPVLYGWLGRMRDNGCRSVAMELSSHALDQERCAELELDVAIMTNIGRDHLDYHGDTERYVAAKARIAELLRPAAERPSGALVVNGCDRYLSALPTGSARVIRFGTDPDADDLDLRLTAANLALTETRLSFDWRSRTLTVTSPLVGRFNVENLTAALAAGIALGFEPDACAAALGRIDQVPGRMERFVLPSGGLAVVDYAHTHDALQAVLETCAELTERRVMVVFGCGGDRDQGKRPLMGAVAATCSDRALDHLGQPPQRTARGHLRGYRRGLRRRGTAALPGVRDRCRSDDRHQGGPVRSRGGRHRGDRRQGTRRLPARGRATAGSGRSPDRGDLVGRGGRSWLKRVTTFPGPWPTCNRPACWPASWCRVTAFSRRCLPGRAPDRERSRTAVSWEPVWTRAPWTPKCSSSPCRALTCTGGNSLPTYCGPVTGS